MDRPRTAVSFECLKHFHALHLQGKVNAYDYYMALIQLTDGSVLFIPVVGTSFFHIRSLSQCSRHGRIGIRNSSDVFGGTATSKCGSMAGARSIRVAWTRRNRERWLSSALYARTPTKIWSRGGNRAKRRKGMSLSMKSQKYLALIDIIHQVQARASPRNRCQLQDEVEEQEGPAKRLLTRMGVLRRREGVPGTPEGPNGRT